MIIGVNPMLRNKFNQEIIERAYEIMRYSTKEKPITSSELQRRLGLNDADGDPNSRALIKVVIHRKYLPLAAGQSGYYVISTYEELRKYFSNLDTRAAKIIERKLLIGRAFKNSYPDQLPEETYDDDIENEEDIDP